jgi:hypothetical protein
MKPQMADIKTLQDVIERLVIYPAEFAMVSLHLWLPVAFCAYAVGRRSWSKWLTLAFVVSEVIAFAISSYAMGLIVVG